MNNPGYEKAIAIIGGTGKEGRGLAYRWALSGCRIIIGSRVLEKAQAAAEEISQLVGNNNLVQGATNLEAARTGEVIVLTVPYSAHRTTLEGIKEIMAGKLLIDVTVPLVPPAVTKVQMPAAGSAAREALEILGENTRVASAFQNISFEHLMSNEPIDCDVLVTGTGKETRAEALTLVAAAGLVGWDAGPIENSMVVEGLTSILIGINKNYKMSSAGIKITGK
jgi:8-hydroxy-5-deazaflavin:NADPH oxidoreductase